MAESTDLAVMPQLEFDRVLRTAYRLCLSGSSDAEVARGLGVSPEKFRRWRMESVELDVAVRDGRDGAEGRVAEALFNKAVGAKTTETRLVKVKDADGSEVVQEFAVVKEYPPDASAAMFWLTNRSGHKWKDVKRMDHSVTHDVSDGLALLLDAVDGRTRTIDGEAEDVPFDERPLKAMGEDDG